MKMALLTYDHKFEVSLEGQKFQIQREINHSQYTVVLVQVQVQVQVYSGFQGLRPIVQFSVNYNKFISLVRIHNDAIYDHIQKQNISEMGVLAADYYTYIFATSSTLL